MPSHFSPFLLPAFFFQRPELHRIPPTSYHLYTRKFGEVHHEEVNSSKPHAEVSELASPFKLEPTKFHVRRSRDRHQRCANECSSSPTNINSSSEAVYLPLKPVALSTLTSKCNEYEQANLISHGFKHPNIETFD
ncbi:hypothetical protein KSP39_PZI019051 [Platanthera zijinensis]|uniref:Uncharacterized protein n=1 Tax=Platanthera zijinensis TaxID=2320716 RepID=A0AAP0B182_9ASPA